MSNNTNVIFDFDFLVYLNNTVHKREEELLDIIS